MLGVTLLVGCILSRERAKVEILLITSWFIETGEECRLDGLIGACADLTMFKAHIFIP